MGDGPENSGAESTANLPVEFQPPSEFRRQQERSGRPIPRLNVPVLAAYLAIGFAMVCWCYFGYQYNSSHFPVSFGAIIVFLLVLGTLLMTLIAILELNRRARMSPVLQRMADLRHGAFLVMAGTSPRLRYARDRWIGRVDFEVGSDYENAFTRLDAVLRQPIGQLEIRKRKTLSNVIWGTDDDVIQLPEGDFSRRFRVSGPDSGFAEKLLTPAVLSAIMRLDELGPVHVDIDCNTARVEIGRDLSSPRKEGALRQFLAEAETIIETAAQ